MTSESRRIQSELRQDGRRCFARWDGPLFDALVSGPAHVLRKALRGQADSGPVLAGYLQLLQQGVGTAAVRQASSGGAWTGFLERCLVELVP